VWARDYATASAEIFRAEERRATPLSMQRCACHAERMHYEHGAQRNIVLHTRTLRAPRLRRYALINI
jgi:hypothetical protein